MKDTRVRGKERKEGRWEREKKRKEVKNQLATRKAHAFLKQ